MSVENSFKSSSEESLKENINAVLINEQVPQKERLIKLNQIAIYQISVLQQNDNRKLLK